VDGAGLWAIVQHAEALDTALADAAFRFLSEAADNVRTHAYIGHGTDLGMEIKTQTDVARGRLILSVRDWGISLTVAA